MKLKDYLKQKPINEYFDLVPATYEGRDLHTYENKKIKIIKIDPKHPNRKIILLEET